MAVERREPLRVNCVGVAPFVEAELNGRFPGRADRRASDPDGLRVAWAKLESTWAAALERVAAMPAATVQIFVGEWSFAQALRHLVLATDMWLGLANRADDPRAAHATPDSVRGELTTPAAGAA